MTWASYIDGLKQQKGVADAAIFTTEGVVCATTDIFKDITVNTHTHTQLLGVSFRTGALTPVSVHIKAQFKMSDFLLGLGDSTKRLFCRSQ